ncbi:septal ring lytic transglycosylase RlpA family protein [Candidatus Venteria ishoeyi]|uniref:septal ring lytic transglycosylase RlpA family protein n=1 Tax=Candidatus Venteria ishoeyi TaxID=1899563 RepID=UPI0025A63652|nr:septal ring lytic transglycosylase RlpA family protein [Candidatus Venteria ishoeyi]MDM8545366.1 septal ring lytic transglycosylase RlpA family protein [Candidatus Venteria ishoeyi]
MRFNFFNIFILMVLLSTAFLSVHANEASDFEHQTGLASYYSDKLQGRSTASGQPYDKDKLSAAHLSLPFGTLLRVTNLANGKHVIIPVNDRGPYRDKRIIDVSRKAAEALDMISAGIIKVSIEIQK